MFYLNFCQCELAEFAGTFTSALNALTTQLTEKLNVKPKWWLKSKSKTGFDISLNDIDHLRHSKQYKCLFPSLSVTLTNRFSWFATLLSYFTNEHCHDALYMTSLSVFAYFHSINSECDATLKCYEKQKLSLFLHWYCVLYGTYKRPIAIENEPDMRIGIMHKIMLWSMNMMAFIHAGEWRVFLFY